MFKRAPRGFTIIEVIIVLAIAGSIMTIVFIAVPSLRRFQSSNQSIKGMYSIIASVGIAQQRYGKPLRLITGSGCSDCACRAPALMTDVACATSWDNARAKISAGGLDISELATDGWGNPYALDENEGEMGLSDCRLDGLRSAGADGILGTSDDISRTIPLQRHPCP